MITASWPEGHHPDDFGVLTIDRPERVTTVVILPASAPLRWLGVTHRKESRS